MKPRQISWKWLLAGLALVLAAGLAFLFPRQFGTPSDLRDRVAAALSAWSGGTVTLTEPLDVRYFPPSLRGGLVISNAEKLPAISSIAAPDFKITLDFLQLVLGRIQLDAVRLGHPMITVRAPTDETAEPIETLLPGSIMALPVKRLRVRHGTIKTASGAKSVKKLEVILKSRGRYGAFTSSGSFAFRGEDVAFSLDSGRIDAAESVKSAPVTVKLTSEPLSARFSGTITAREGFEGEGEMRAEIPDGRAALRWLGVTVPAGDSVKDVQVSGYAHWTGTTVTLDDAAILIDGNEAEGLLAFKSGVRPRIDGTLAFDTLTLDPYLLGSELDTDPLFAWALLKYVDADLRLSAGEMSLADLDLGHGGLTVNATRGAISTEVGELEICGGLATGRFSLDLSRSRADIVLTGALTDITIDSCLAPLSVEVPVRGVWTVKLDISTAGTRYEELVRRLAGGATISAKDGTVPIDFSELTVTSRPEGEGWSRDGGTAFTTLDADCSLSDGHVWCPRFRMQAADGIVSGVGGLDVAQQTLDWDFVIAHPAAPLDSSQLVMETSPRVTVHGSVSDPSIQREQEPIAAGPQPANSPKDATVTPQ
jgi:AsmA protein